MQFLVIGTGTGVGKTYITTNLCKLLAQKKKRVMAIKPIITGFSSLDKRNDLNLILDSLSLVKNEENLNKISLFRLKEPYSPDIAGDLENVKISYSGIVDFCQENIEIAKSTESYLFIESAGGIMTPISSGRTFLDLTRDLKLPVILITSNYLGTISHTLTAISCLNGINIRLVILNTTEPLDNNPILKSLKCFYREAILDVSYNSSLHEIINYIV